MSYLEIMSTLEIILLHVRTADHVERLGVLEEYEKVISEALEKIRRIDEESGLDTMILNGAILDFAD